MKTSALRHLLCCVLALLVWTNAFAQLGLGPRRLVDADAPTLKNPEHLGKGLIKPGYVNEIGGVAFDKIASPVSDLTFRSLSLDYNPNVADGNRLGVIVDGKRVSSPVYDWQLIPIAKFANSRYYACVTLYGRLINPEEQDRVLNNRDRIINYHPEFSNTLLGLRLFQLDTLIWEPNAIDLPKDGERYILGEGEAEPDISSNSRGLKEFTDYIKQFKGNLAATLRSFVICDYGRDIQFDFKGGTLTITGEPFFYIWYSKSNGRDYNEEAVDNSVADIIKILIDSARLKSPRAFNEKEWYINMLVKLVPKFKEEFKDMYKREWLRLTTRGDNALTAFLRKSTVSWLRDEMRKLLLYWIAKSVVPLKEYSKWISDQPKLLRKINPAVWNAGVNVMRYAAFFRYCKQKYPKQWRNFINQINKVPMPKPQIKTPSIFQ